MYNRSKVFFAACFALLLFGMTLITLGSILPTLTSKFSSIGLNKSNLVALLPMGILSGSLIFGPIVDRYGYKLVLLISILISALALAGVGLANSLSQLYVCIFLIGFGGGVINGSTSALVADISSDHKGASLSLLGVFYGIGAIGMPLLLGLLSKSYSYSIILCAVAIFMLIPMLYFMSLVFPSPKQAQGFPIKEGIALLKQPLLLLPSFFLFFQSGVESLSNNFSTSYLKDKLVISDEKALYALSFSIVGLTLSRLVMGSLLKKFSSHILLLVSLGMVLIGSLLMTIASNYIMIFPAVILIGFGLGAGFPIMLGYIGQLYPALSGTAFSIALVIALTGNTIINFGFGEISSSIGIKYLPYTIGFYILLMILLVFIIHKKLKTKIKL